MKLDRLTSVLEAIADAGGSVSPSEVQQATGDYPDLPVTGYCNCLQTIDY